MLNKNPSIQAKKEMWDGRIPQITHLVTHCGYRLKDLANHYDCNVNLLSSVLHRRELSVVNMRYQHAKKLAGKL